ncbi:MAG: hypothetical protein ACQEP6_03155 [Patescibacteria group bacterium]
MAIKKRHKIIIETFRVLGGEATLKEVSEKTGFHINGLSQSMPSIAKYVDLQFIGGKGKERRYRIVS